MEIIIKALKSRTNWAIAFAFVFNGWQAINGFFSPEVNLAINGLLSVSAMYFKLNPSQDY